MCRGNVPPPVLGRIEAPSGAVVAACVCTCTCACAAIAMGMVTGIWRFGFPELFSARAAGLAMPLTPSGAVGGGGWFAGVLPVRGEVHVRVPRTEGGLCLILRRASRADAVSRAAAAEGVGLCIAKSL